MKKILSVSVDTITLNIISSLLLEHTGDFEILTAESLQESETILKKIKIDIVIIDLSLPTPGDLSSLKKITNEHTRLPFIVMTGFETAEIESAIKAIGAVRYFEKPVDFKTLADKVAEEMEGGVGGAIHGISLASFLQMSEMEKTSCTLKVKAGENKEGRLYLLKGALVAAVTETASKEEAVYEILCWDSPVIEIEDPNPNIAREIKAPLMNLLMEGLRRKDEQSGNKTGRPNAAAKRAPTVSISSATARLQVEEEASLREEAQSEAQAKAQEKVQAKAQKEAAAQEMLMSLPADLAEKAKSQSDKVSAAGEILKRQQRTANMIKGGILAVLLVILAVVWFIVGAPWLKEWQYNKMQADVGATRQIEEKLVILDDYIVGADEAYRKKAEDQKAVVVKNLHDQKYEEALQQVDELPIDADYQDKAEQIYTAYLEAYPDSEYVAQIKQKIDQIPSVVKDADLRKLKAIPPEKLAERIDAYNGYLAAHPKGANTPIVQQMVDNLGEQFYGHITDAKKECDKKKNWRKCIKLCDFFTEKFKGHARSKDIAKLKQTMAAQKDWLAITEKIDEHEIYSEKAEALYRQFIREHGNTSLVREPKRRLAHIQNTQNAKTAWENLLRNAKNENISIFDRVAAAEAYLANNPPEPYKSNAKQVLAWLHQEEAKTTGRLERQEQETKYQQQRQQIIGSKEAAVRAALRRSGGKYVEKQPGTLTDTRTGLTWCMLDSSVMTEECLNFKAAKNYVSRLNTGGYTDWRLPTPNELIIIYNNNPSFPAVEGTRWYWSSEVFSAAWQKKVSTVKRTSSGVWQKSETDLDQCGAVRAVRP